MRVAFLTVLMIAAGCSAADFPAPATNIPVYGSSASAVFAGGCFWGVEAVFEKLEGVTRVVSGYAGGTRSSARYLLVSSGQTGHAESVQIMYDPKRISFGRLLQVFFSVAHDPTELNRQGPDEGPQYRSAVFYASPEQKTVVEAYIRQLNDAKIFRRPIATKITQLDGFYAAEEEHQNFVVRNPRHQYVVFHDLPKLEQLRKRYPEWVKD